MSVATTRLDPDELAALEEQRSFLLESLSDLEREHDAGDLDDHDYAALKDDYTARAAQVLRSIDQQREARQAARRPRRPGRILAVVAGVAAVAVGAGALVAQSSGERRPGQTLSGEDVGADPEQAAAPTEAGQQAAACVEQFGEVEPVDVIRCFDRALEANPDDPTALTYKGWILYQFGTQGGSAELQANGKENLDRAVTVEPHSAEPHVFRAIIARNEGRPADARAELAEVDRRGGVPPAMEPLLDQLRQDVDQ